MLVTPSTEDWALARRIRNEFKAKPEAQHIAMTHALAHLAATVRIFKPANVLELGAGIGTITKLLLEIPDGPSRIIATEDNAVCLAALERNLTGLELSGVTIVTTLEDLLDLEMAYDLVICDGGFQDTRQYGGIAEGTVCFFEGNRSPDRRILSAALQDRGLAFSGRNYNRWGWRLFIRQPRDADGVRRRRPKFKRRRGCWIGSVVTA